MHMNVAVSARGSIIYLFWLRFSTAISILEVSISENSILQRCAWRRWHISKPTRCQISHNLLATHQSIQETQRQPRGSLWHFILQEYQALEVCLPLAMLLQTFANILQISSSQHSSHSWKMSQRQMLPTHSTISIWIVMKMQGSITKTRRTR